MNKTQISIIIGVMCFLLSLAIVVQYNTISQATETVGQARTENGLRDQVLKWKEKYDVTYNNLEKAQDKLENMRQDAVQNDQDSQNMKEELNLANILLGTTEVEGNGITIELEDGKDLVHQEDLIEIVNELKNAGAEAIAVNDQRIVNTSFISCDGNVILIDGNKVGTPFNILAIGSPEMLYGALTRNGGFLEILQNKYGIKVEVKKTNNLKIPKYNGLINYKYMKIVD